MPVMESGVKRRRRKTNWEAESGRRTPVLMRLPLQGNVISSMPFQSVMDSVAPLAASIARHGLLQPVVVCRNGKEGSYSLVLGGRRLAACRLLGMKEIDALLFDMDEAEGAACLLEEEEVRRKLPVCMSAELVDRMGLKALEASYALDSRKLRRFHAILKLSDKTRKLIRNADLSLEQAEPLLKIRDEQRQLEAASIIAGRELTPAQAQRLVCGPQNRDDRMIESSSGKRRALRAAMEEVSVLAKRLQQQGIDACVAVHSQENGLCIQLRISNS